MKSKPKNVVPLYITAAVVLFALVLHVISRNLAERTQSEDPKSRTDTALMEELDPAKLRRTAERGGLNLVPMQRKANAWDAFEALHARITQALSDDFDSVFGKNFARAYERALAEVSAKEED